MIGLTFPTDAASTPAIGTTGAAATTRTATTAGPATTWIQTTITPAGCLIAGYVSFNGLCYKDFAELKTYDEAGERCAADGAVLAMPKDNETETFLHDLRGAGRRWIGLTDAKNEGRWVFVDGQSLASSGYDNWGTGQPDDGAGGRSEECGEVVGTAWNDFTCDSNVGLICQLGIGMPSNLRLISRDADRLGVEWGASSSVESYRVTYKTSGVNETDSVESTPNNTHTIGNLTAGTLYTIRVYSINGVREGHWGTQPEAPTNLVNDVFARTTDSLGVFWTASSSADTYRVTYQASGGTETDSVTSTPNTTHTIGNLTAGTEYTVRVYGIKHGVESEPIETDVTTRPESPTNLRLWRDSYGILVSWDAPGSVDTYNVTYQTAGGAENGDIVPGYRTNHDISGLLQLGTLYTFRVYAIKNDVASLPIQGDHRTIAGNPRNINIPPSGVTETSINVTWSPADGAKDFYNITISPPDGDNPTGSVNATDPLVYTFTGLTAGTLYTISVTTISGGVNNYWPTEMWRRTKPNPPGDITTDIVSASIATWEPSTGGVVSGYEIIYRTNDGSSYHTVTVNSGTTTAPSPVALTIGALYTLEMYAFSDDGYGRYRTESERRIITVGLNTTAPTTLRLIQTCRLSFQQFSVLEETTNGATFNVMILDSTSCHNCSIVYEDTTCFIDDIYNVSSYVVANSSSSTSCQVFIISPIDRETTSSIRFDVSWTRSVYNNGYNIQEDCGSIPVEIVVVDVNDNPPVFGADLKTTLYIRDRTPVDTIIAVASAQDADTGTNAEVTYSIPSSTGSEYFEIDRYGVVTTKRELTQTLLSQSGLLLDEEVEVVVMATDGVHNTTTTLSFRFLDTGGVNATISALEVYIPEEQPPGTTVINLRDRRPFDDDNIIYSFTHASNSFELNSTSGEVTTAEVLDREQEEVYELTISASDPSGCYASAFIKITVRVEDVNDNAPVFLEAAYSGRIQEDAGRGDPVAIDGPGISAVDEDLGENSRVTYSIDCCQDVFVIDNVTGEITTMDSDSFIFLDRENTSVYHLTVVAQDNPSDVSLRMESRTDVTISVLDINDNRPTFIGTSPFEIFLFENETVNTIVATIKAVDPDEGTNGNSTVFYEIRSGAEGRFTVNPRTGEVKIAGKLDRETKDFYQLEILASDGGNPPLVSNGFDLNIWVEDVNDNVPSFTTPAYVLSVQEETKTGTVIGNITAEDLDVGTNAQIKYAFTEAVQHFAIDETAGTLTVLSILDFDNVTHPKISRFKVQASDGTFSSTVDVQVNLVDINDNAPSYRVDRYEVTLLFVAFPAIVTAVDATDKDSGTNAEISYNFTDERSGLFDINPFNGIIRLVGNPGSTEVTYNLTVAATDSGYPPMNSTISLTIDISSLADASSTRVSFNGREFVGYVEESDNNEQVVTHLDATVIYSGPTPAPGACPLKYKIAASSDDFEFAVNETTGEIRTRDARFDREIKASYTFAVVVEITCPDLIFDYTSVLVHVNDTNDESPTFESSTYSFEASEGSAGIEVGRVQAVDKDAGSNADFNYIINPSGSPFRIDTNGRITVSTPLDRETMDIYSLIIIAEDMGVPSLNGTCTVNVRVLDINDNEPMFADSAYRTDLPEDAVLAQLTITIIATDNDVGSNGEIQFSLHGEGSNLFSIDDVSGVVTLTGRLDYEERHNYDLTITATDNGHPNITASAPLTIGVTDVNDNPPKFDRDVYNSSTYRDVPTTEVLVTVSATDQDSGVNAQILYSITRQYGIKPPGAMIGETPFYITNLTGEIGVTNHFLNDDIQQYELIITAIDMGDPPLSTTTTVVIDVANTNFFAPEFLNTPVYRTMDEDIGTLWNSREVAKIKATDTDTEAEGQVMFLLPSNDYISDLFRVTTTKEDSDRNLEIFVGTIRTNASLDREAHPSGLNLTVLAVDQGATPKTSTALIHITLNDVNDNPPTLVVPTELVTIPQSSPVGTSVVKVEVADPDLVNVFSFETRHEYFSINENTGEIFTITDLAGEGGQNLVIIVDDGSGKIDYGIISIFIGNPNLHAPMFSQPVYQTTVQQYLEMGTDLTDLNIFACDMDCPESCNVYLSTNCTTNEGRLEYGIEASSNFGYIFTINAYTGLISTRYLLESSIPNYTLVIIATDQSENSRTGSASVRIDVVDFGATSVAPTALPCNTQKLETALYGVSGFAGLMLMITIGLIVRLVLTNRRVKQMSTAHLTTPAFTAPQYDYVPGMTDYAYAEGTGTDDDSPAPPPVANRPPLTLNNEERRPQATDRRHNVAMEMRSRMRPELQRQGRTADERSRNSIYREQKYGYLQLNTRDTSNTASPTAETAVADKYGYLKPANQARQNNQRGQPNDPYQNDKMNRQNQVYTKDIPAPDYDVLPAETRI